MMEHKAFIFDYEAFHRELFPILRDALASGDYNRLATFIEENRELLTDPYEGEPLAEDWKETIVNSDVHQYGDFAMTKYYAPSNDIGLGSSWQTIQELVASDQSISPILGSVVGPADDPFDPGKMGAYFQSNDQVKESLEYLRELAQQNSSKEINAAVGMLQHISQSGKGLYVTF